MESNLTDAFFVFLFCSLSGMGIGGGGLLVVYLTVLRGLGQFFSQGINLFVFLFSSASSGTVNLKKRTVNYPLCLFLSVCGCIGSALGAGLAGTINDRVLRIIFGIFLVCTSLISIYIHKK